MRATASISAFEKFRLTGPPGRDCEVMATLEPPAPVGAGDDAAAGAGGGAGTKTGAVKGAGVAADGGADAPGEAPGDPPKGAADGVDERAGAGTAF